MAILRWRDPADSLKSDLLRLLHHSEEPYDSVALRLAGFNLKDIQILQETELIRDTTRVRWLNDSTFIIDTLGWITE